MRRIVLALATVSVASAAACVTATPACTEWVSLGKAPAHSLIYRSHSLDTRNEAITRALVVLHGSTREADGNFRSAMAAAFLAGALEDTVVVSPRIASAAANCHDKLAANEISYNCNSWRFGGAAASNPEVNSFDFLDEVLRKLARKEIFPNLKQIVFLGHSAGGQVVNRYEMANQVHEKLGVPVTYIVANTSSFAYPDSTRPTDAAYSVQSHAPGYIPEIPPNTAPFREFGGGRDCTTYDRWPYGFKDRTGYAAKQTDEQLRKQLISRPTVYMMGELDVFPLGGFDSSCPAMAQGPTRLARGEAFGKFVNEKLGAHHVVKVIPLCGHNGRCMMTSEDALPLLFPK